LFYAALWSAAIRFPLTLLRVYRALVEHGGGGREFIKYFLRIFVGLGYKPFDRTLPSEEEKERVRGDYTTAWILGILELVTFPFLFAAGRDVYVAAWIGLKVVAQYKHWIEDRGSFTAFLIGNALVLIFAFKVLQRYIGAAA